MPTHSPGSQPGHQLSRRPARRRRALSGGGAIGLVVTLAVVAVMAYLELPALTTTPGVGTGTATTQPGTPATPQGPIPAAQNATAVATAQSVAAEAATAAQLNGQPPTAAELQSAAADASNSDTTVTVTVAPGGFANANVAQLSITTSAGTSLVCVSLPGGGTSAVVSCS